MFREGRARVHNSFGIERSAETRDGCEEEGHWAAANAAASNRRSLIAVWSLYWKDGSPWAELEAVAEIAMRRRRSELGDGDQWTGDD